MSVAFRRESDEEHLEPKFEIPLPAGPNLVTARGFALIEAKIAALKAAATGPSDAVAVQHGQRDLRYWQARLSTAQIVPAPAGDTVEFGCRVRFLLDGVERDVAIVGHDEADPAADRISFASPLARTLMHGEVGDLLDFRGRGGAIEILAISPRLDDARQV